ncbi:MAG: Rieske (2Fe-2S) protein [Chlamydiales bacterium]|nr:Rieske (2Fe-2S) protein [Chlamydiales bacterium]
MLKIAKTYHLLPGKSISVDLPNGKVIALFNIDGIFYAIDNFCPHKGAPLAEGKLQECQISCPWHNWKFDVTTGKSINQEGECVKTYPLTIKGDDIYIPIK